VSSDTSLETLADGVLDGDSLSLARLISRIESREPGYRDVMDGIYRRAGDAWTIGVTGPPGVGKSTLVDDLVAEFRERDQTVGIIAVDPSSPFTGGSVLGDRGRMASTISDDGVFCRSMSARGEVGGLSNATSDVVYLMDAFGFDMVIIETVGAGQSEIDIVRTADTVAVTVHPSAGDEVQTIKAGILEIGDVFVVNKADLTVPRRRDSNSPRWSCGGSPRATGFRRSSQRSQPRGQGLWNSSTRYTNIGSFSPRKESLAGTRCGSETR
jgi:LAO/AO transport system kinase